MKKRIFKSKLLYLPLFIVLAGCVESGPEYTDELDVVYTNYDNAFDYSSTTTYSIPDKIVKIDSDSFDEEDGPEFVDPVYADVIIGGIKKNMDAIGWQEVDKDANPDVVLLPSAMETLNLYYYYDWGYWGWWGYPGYGPDWGWWYPGYYPPAVSGYRSGSLLIQMTYPAGIGVNDKIPVIWTVAINGLLEGSTSNIQSRMESTVDQAFKQSPYLNK